MSYSPCPSPKFQAFDSNGDPLSGGKLYTYEPGSSTPKDTYTDSTGGTSNANPVVLNSRGEADVWLTGSYKLVLKTSADVTVWTVDNVAEIPTSQSTSEWVSGPAPTYVSASQFTLVGDQTTVFHVGRRCKFTVSAGTVYGKITASAYTSLTTVTVSLDSGSLDSGLSSVWYGFISSTNTSSPIGLATTNTFTATQTIQALLDLDHANGGQIKFPASQNASANANTFDDYEEGTWTPSPTNLTVVGTPTYAGAYTKMGRMVFAQMQVSATTSTASTINSTYFEGLPYSTGNNYGTCASANSNTVTSYGIGAIAVSKVYTPTWSATGQAVNTAFFYTT